MTTVKLTVYEEDRDPEKILELVLNEGDDLIELNALEKDGTLWWLLSVTPEGVILAGDIPEEVGFPVDKTGHLKIIKD